MGCKFKKFQTTSTQQLANKEIKLHLVNGGTIKLNLLHTEIFDMSNGSIFILGRALDQKIGSLDELTLHSCEEENWKL
ncbi:hypothetical protein [Shimazuella kribbensis]|uniref:hypothetical protein n=1 Tax=Shimazuella kribbensis TaxID=139808 RepID=UPI0003FAEED8|nr:hypothetical protein [Shimazuella kribbensis]